jgi:hypothetical protein
VVLGIRFSDAIPETNPLGLLVREEKLVFDTIQLLAVWPVLVSYRNIVVGIVGWYYD